MRLYIIYCGPRLGGQEAVEWITDQIRGVVAERTQTGPIDMFEEDAKVHRPQQDPHLKIQKKRQLATPVGGFS